LKVAAWFTDDGTVVFANDPPAVGPSAIKAGVGRFMSSIRGMRHEFVNLWGGRRHDGVRSARDVYDEERRHRRHPSGDIPRAAW
jgi:hypothetical protein